MLETGSGVAQAVFTQAGSERRGRVLLSSLQGLLLGREG